MCNFEVNDIIQLVRDLNWNKKGDIAIVRNGGWDCFDVTFEGCSDIVLTRKENFRKVDMQSLYKFKN